MRIKRAPNNRRTGMIIGFGLLTVAFVAIYPFYRVLTAPPYFEQVECEGTILSITETEYVYGDMAVLSGNDTIVVSVRLDSKFDDFWSFAKVGDYIKKHKGEREVLITKKETQEVKEFNYPFVKD